MLQTGAVLDDGDFSLEAAFNVALAEANQGQDNPFEAQVKRTSPGDLLHAETEMCALLEVSFMFTNWRRYEIYLYNDS